MQYNILLSCHHFIFLLLTNLCRLQLQFQQSKFIWTRCRKKWHVIYSFWQLWLNIILSLCSYLRCPNIHHNTKCVSQSIETFPSSYLTVHFYAPAIKWLGHIVLPLSVIPSFRHSVIPDSVSAHYLSHTWRFSNEIWYIGLSREYAGWVRIWVRSNNFRQSYAPWT